MLVFFSAERVDFQLDGRVLVDPIFENKVMNIFLNVKPFQYDKHLARMIFNYDSFAKNLKKGSENSVCRCYEEENSKYVDLNYGHTLTGNLVISLILTPIVVR